MWDPYAEVQSVVLPNGLTIYCSYWPGRAFEIIECIIHSGADQDPDGKEGLAHFVEHVVVENGIEPHALTQQFFREHGDRVNFGTTEPAATKYGFCLPADRNILAEALHRFGHRLFGAELTKEIEEQRLIILAEFRKKFPSQKRWEDFLEGHALLTRDGRLWKGGNGLGTEETIQLIAQSDLQEFYDAHYTPANMSIVCSGGVPLSELVSLFEASPFAKMIPGKRTALQPIMTEVGDYSSRRKEVSVSEKNQGAGRNTCRYETHALVPGTYAWPAVLQLCDLFGDRLHQELRESHHLVYAVNVSLSRVNGTYYAIGVTCEGIALHAIERVEELVDQTIMTVSNHEAICQRQRQTARSGRIYFDPTVEGIAKGMIGDLITYQRIKTRQEDIDASDAVTFQDVLNVLPFLAPEKRWTKITRP